MFDKKTIKSANKFSLWHVLRDKHTIVQTSYLLLIQYLCKVSL